MTAARDDIRAELAKTFDRVSNGRAQVDQLRDDARIVEDIGLASLDLLDLRCELQERWQTVIADSEMMQLRTVGDIVRLIEQRVDPTL